VRGKYLLLLGKGAVRKLAEKEEKLLHDPMRDAKRHAAKERRSENKLGARIKKGGAAGHRKSRNLGNESKRSTTTTKDRDKFR